MSNPATPEALIAALRPITDRVRRNNTAIKVADGSSRWVDEPLTEARLKKHLNGGPARGCCPIEQGSTTTRLALLDLDSHKGETPWPEMVEVAQQLIGVLSLEGLAVIPFRSSGGKGLHLYLIWDAPQDAYSVRQLLTTLLAAVGYRNGAGGVKNHEIEIFPKQNQVGETGYGNQFILPLAGKSTPLSPGSLALLDRDAIIDLPWPLSEPVPVLDRPVPPSPITLDEIADLKQIRSALAAIRNEGADELDYDTWRNVIFAIHYATGGSADGLALAHEFSSRSTKYDPEFLDNRVWPYIESDRPGAVTDRTILYLARAHGWTEDVADEFDIVPEPEPLPTRRHETPHLPRFTPVQAAEFSASGSTSWLIKGVLPAADLAVLYGASGSGKTFMALDMAMAIARGEPWRGHRVRKGRVAYVCAEGAGGFRRRLQAYAHQHALALDAIDIFVIPAAPNLLKGDDVRDLVKALKEAGEWALVIMDTFAQVMPGGNENSGEDVGQALSHCKVVSAVIGCPVLLIHHSGKDEARGARGWSGLRAACDTEMEVIRAEDARALTITKQKDGEEGQDFCFKLLTVTLGLDDDGDPITSCVVDHVDGTAKAVRKAKRKMGPVETIVYQTLLEGMELDSGGMDREDLIMTSIGKIDQEEGKRDRRRDRVVRALDEMIRAKRVEIVGGKVVLATEEDE